jgi:hypothetical protein
MGSHASGPLPQVESAASNLNIPEPDRDNVPNWWSYDVPDVPCPNDPSVENEFEAKYAFAVVYQQMRTA